MPRSAAILERLVLHCYGVELRVVDTAGLGLCHRLRQTVPPEFATTGSPDVAIEYLVTTAPEAGSTRPEYVVTRDGVAVFATVVPDDVYWWVRRDIDGSVARRCQRFSFVRAGVVAWRDVVIVIPGRQRMGPSTIVSTLVRRGAEYYSDSFAVLDHVGRVHPYRSLIEHDPASVKSVRWIRGGDGPAAKAIGVIVTGRFTSWDGSWPTIVRGPLTALPLLDHSMQERGDHARLQQVAAHVAAGAVELRGPWPDTDGIAGTILDIVDDALETVGRTNSLGGAESLATALADAAEHRLRRPVFPPARPKRDLVVARYVQLPDVLAPDEHERVLQSVRLAEPDGWQVRRCGVHGNDAWIDDDARDSLAPGAERDTIWQLFEPHLRAALPFVRRQLHVLQFPLGRIEWRVSRCTPHRAVDTDGADEHSDASGQRISGAYFLRAPSTREGGELRLYDRWRTTDGETGADTYSVLRPPTNTLVFWPTGTPHELIAPAPPSDAEFLITFTFGEDTAADIATDHACREECRDRADALVPAPPRQPGRRTGRQLAAIVVPAYRPVSADDRIALRHLRTHLGEFDRYVIGAHVPADGFADFKRAPDCTFTDRMSYNRLLTSEHFYRAFEGYEYLLIYQLDSLVFSNQLEAWCRRGVDYVGAPWFERWHRERPTPTEFPLDVVDGFGTVGNGGFSLRNVDAALAVLAAMQRPVYDRYVRGLLARDLHEDIFFAFVAPRLVNGFRIPSAREALQFAFETEPRYCYHENRQQMPFGCHGWTGYDCEFWEPFLMR